MAGCRGSRINTWWSVAVLAASPILSGAAPAPDSSGSWSDEVAERVDITARAWLAAGAGWVSRAGPFPVSASDPGIDVHTGDRTLRVTLSRWGRASDVRAVSPAAPQLGACATTRLDLFRRCERRLEYVRGDVVEWYVADERGLEQGFDVATPPPGRGELVFVTDVDGSAEYVRWVDAFAVDARGAALPVRFEADGGTTRLFVDDANAVYPIRVDPYLVPNASWSGSGFQFSAAFGSALAFGDFDRDGRVDLAVGAPGLNSGAISAGSALVFAGTSAGLETFAGWAGPGDSSYDHAGSALAVGDFDGDGYDDLAVGAPGANTQGMNAGSVVVYLGGPSGLAGTPSWTLWGAADAGAFGSVIANAGDTNADGADDLAVGAPYEDEATWGGRVYLYRGPAPPGPPTWSWTPAEPYAEAGRSLAGLGDVDGDGRDDLAVGVPGYDNGGGAPTGRVVAFRGVLWGLTSNPMWTRNAVLGDRFGEFVLGLGDVLLGPAPELLVGTPLAADTFVDEGAFEVFEGATAQFLFQPSPIQQVYGGETGALFGFGGTVAHLDADGRPDVVIAAPQGGAVGRILVHAGVNTGLAPTPAMTLSGVDPSGGFGTAVAAGDVDGDGFEDVAVGTPYEGITFQGEGRVDLFDGLPGFIDLDGDGYCASGNCATGLTAGDCDDLDPDVHPGQQEACDGADTNCDGSRLPTELDVDGDGWFTCNGDCDDTEPTTFPGADELCDGIDNDCDGLDNGEGVAVYWWPDEDRDGYGQIGAEPQLACDQPAGWVDYADDCDDGDPSINPAATEILCSDRDDDCSPATPDRPDEDRDGFQPCDDCTGQGPLVACGDCDDGDRVVHPGGEETCGDGIDQDCDDVDAPCVLPPPCLEPDNRCEEPACACTQAVGPTEASWGALLLIAAVGLRRRRTLSPRLPAALLGASLLVAPGAASAEEQSMDTQLLRPSFMPWAFYGNPGADPGPKGSMRIGVVFQYEAAPIVLQFDHDEVHEVISDRYSLTIGGAAAPVDGLGVAISAPIYVMHGALTGDAPRVAAVGDFRLEVMYRLVKLRHLAVAPRAEIFLPLSRATPNLFNGEGTPRVLLGVAGQGMIGPITVMLGLEALLRRKVVTGYDFQLGNELGLTVGVRGWPIAGRVAILGEVQTRAGVARMFTGEAENPVEARFGIRALPHRAVQLDVAVGFGLGGGYGAPVYRAIVGVAFRDHDEEMEAREPAWPEEPEPEPEPEPDPADVLIIDPKPEKRDMKVADTTPVEQEEEPEEAPPTATIVGDLIVVSEEIQFAYDSAVILEESHPVLAAIAEVMTRSPQIAHLLIEGHASAEGKRDYNWDLSNRRAQAVFKHLVEAGVDPRRLSHRGMGEVVSTTDEPTAEGEEPVELDRRVELRIVKVYSEWVDEIPDWSKDTPPVPWEETEDDE